MFFSFSRFGWLNLKFFCFFGLFGFFLLVGGKSFAQSYYYEEDIDLWRENQIPPSAFPNDPYQGLQTNPQRDPNYIDSYEVESNLKQGTLDLQDQQNTSPKRLQKNAPTRKMPGDKTTNQGSSVGDPSNNQTVQTTQTASSQGQIGEKTANPDLFPYKTRYYITSIAYGAGAGAIVGLALAGTSKSTESTKMNLIGGSIVLGGICGFLFSIFKPPPSAALLSEYSKDQEQGGQGIKTEPSFLNPKAKMVGAGQVFSQVEFHFPIYNRFF